MSRNAVAVVSSLMFAVLAVLLVLIPVPYVAWRPGQTIDVLEQRDDRGTIEVSGVPTFPTTGRLLMTTVSTTRVDATLSLPEAIFVYLGADYDAMPREVIYPAGKTSDQVQNEAVAMMDTSRNNATVAALRAAGVPVEEWPRISSVLLSGPSVNVLQPGDLILAVDGISTSNRDAVAAQIATHQVGDSIVFEVDRSGQRLTVSVIARAGSSDARRPSIGVSIDTGYLFEPTVTFGVDPSVTGPSAGLIFALGIYDQVTDGQLIGDKTVAGTGTISAAGRVGTIGAIRQKIKGAERDGASYFLVPEGNCDNVGDLEVAIPLIKVGTLNDAISALQLINEGNIAEVPTCG